MKQLFGDYPCRLDEKGRLRLPSALLKQFGEQESYDLVINRGEDKCLNLYTKEVWDKKAEEVFELIGNTDNRMVKRAFRAGATMIVTDKSERILLSKDLLKYADIDRDLILSSVDDYIEIWEPENHKNMIEEAVRRYAELKEKALRKKENEKGV